MPVHWHFIEHLVGSNCSTPLIMHQIFMYVLVILLQSSICFARDAGKQYFADERDGLVQFRDSVNSTILHANWTGPPCYENRTRWFGVVCYDWHVTSIVLDGLRLSGSLAGNVSVFRSLSFLTRLSLAGNSISGPLPDLKGLSGIESISLSSNRFSGSIPYEYVGFPMLSRLELQENSLSGSLPPFDQKTLRVFNVSHNRLRGSIPENSVLERFSADSFGDNAGLCGPPLVTACSAHPPSIGGERKGEQSRNNIVHHPWIVAMIAALPSSVMAVVIYCYCRNIRRKKARKLEMARRKMQWSDNNSGDGEYSKKTKKSEELEFLDESRVTKFNFDDLLKAPGEVIGKGEIGSTYKALIDAGGAAVAVKRLKYVESLKRKDFAEQIRLIGNLRHENLVEILSFYYSKKEKLIVYNFVPNIGNLFQLLHGNKDVGKMALNWCSKFSIINQIAKAIAFLHKYQQPSTRVPHGNLKSSNVIIQRGCRQIAQSSYHIKLTDYGFLPLLVSRTSCAKLAIGKTPEFLHGKRLTQKADVYCFGMIALEVITGKLEGDLFEWMGRIVKNDGSIDLLLEGDGMVVAKDGCERRQMFDMIEVALWCMDVVPRSSHYDPSLVKVNKTTAGFIVGINLRS